MREKVFWEEGVKGIPDDMNALHDLSETALGDLVYALSGGFSDLLFEDAPPGYSHSPPTIQVTIPDQSFAVSGVVERILSAAPVLISDTPPAQHRIFFVIRRIDANATRDVLQTNGTDITVTSQSVVYRKETTPRVEVTHSPDALTPAPAPTLSADDIGYVEYCTVIWDGATLTVTPNTADLYTFPGAGVTYAPHASRHLPSGTDPIPVAALAAVPEGSSAGLMPAGGWAVLIEALQSLVVDSSSPFIQRIISGTNAPANPKIVTIKLLYDESLVVVDVGGTKKLGLNFVVGPYAGSSGRPAQSNHRHPPSESPIALLGYVEEVDAGDLGQVLTVPAFTGLSVLSHAVAYWVPPGRTYPMVECGWVSLSAGEVGTRVTIHGAKEIRIETGALGFVKMSDALKTYVTGITGGITWESSDNGNIARSGKIVVRLMGER